MPGIISERLFAVFDQNGDGFVDILEFIAGMCTMFSGTFENLVTFIFNFYDFDKDGVISKEDIRVVLSYVPLNTKYKENKLKFERYFDDKARTIKIELKAKRSFTKYLKRPLERRKH